METVEWLRRRVRSIAKAVEKLGRSGDELGVESPLRSFEVRLDLLIRNLHAVEVATDVVQTSVSAGVTEWALTLAEDLSSQTAAVIRDEDVFVPALAEFGPLLVIDATEGVTNWSGFMETARACNAPTVRLPILELDHFQRDTLLRSVATRCAEVMGAATRIVFAFDSRRFETDVLDSFKMFDQLRQHSFDVLHISAHGSYAEPLKKQALLDAMATLKLVDNVMLESLSCARLISNVMHEHTAAASQRLVSFWLDAAEPAVVHEGGLAGKAHAFDPASTITAPILFGAGSSIRQMKMVMTASAE